MEVLSFKKGTDKNLLYYSCFGGGQTPSESIQRALSYLAGKKIKLSVNVRGHRKKWVKMAIINAESALETRLSQQQRTIDRLIDLQKILKLNSELSRIECYDISHTAGEGTVGSFVVFD